MEKHPSKLFIISTLLSSLIITGGIFVVLNNLKNPNPEKSSFASTVPTPTPDNSKQEILSPDGKYTLTVENKDRANAVVAQTFSITTNEDKTPVTILNKNSNKDNLLTVPFNTFSPNNKYLFLEYKKDGSPVHIVLRTDGKDMTKDEKYVEIESRFYDKYPDFKITEVTGWGGYTLVVFNTDTAEGKAGPSWWFDATSLSFIRLSTRFN